MNPFQLLEISPTKDKLKIRRAYVRMTKKHHPDQGGKAGALEEIQAAYNMLVKNDYQPPTIRSEIKLNAIDLLTGCNTTAIIGIFAEVDTIEANLSEEQISAIIEDDISVIGELD